MSQIFLRHRIEYAVAKICYHYATQYSFVFFSSKRIDYFIYSKCKTDKRKKHS